MSDQAPDPKNGRDGDQEPIRNELWNPLAAAGSSLSHLIRFFGFCLAAILLIIPVLGLSPFVLLGLSKWAGYAFGLGISIVLLILWERRRGEELGIIIIECLLLIVLSYFLMAAMMPHYDYLYKFTFGSQLNNN